MLSRHDTVIESAKARFCTGASPQPAAGSGPQRHERMTRRQILALVVSSAVHDHVSGRVMRRGFTSRSNSAAET
jgi:hypothetical protein